MPAEFGELPRIGVLHAPFGAADLRELSRAARGLCRPVLLFREQIAEANPVLRTLAGRLFEAVTVSDSQVAGQARRLGLAGLTTFHDGELDHVDLAAAELGFAGIGKVAQPWDKLVQRQRLAAAGLTSVRAVAVDGPDDLIAAVDRIGLPGVLKPRRANTGAGLALLDRQQDVSHQCGNRTIWQRLVYESRIPEGRHPAGHDWLADYISVETISTDTHRQVAVVDKLRPSLVRRAGLDAADSLLEDR